MGAFDIKKVRERHLLKCVHEQIALTVDCYHTWRNTNAEITNNFALKTILFAGTGTEAG